MECGIQLGHGMRGYAQTLIKEWGGGTVILGPRNFRSKSGDPCDALIDFSRRIKKEGAKTLIDPQLFVPGDPHQNLAKFRHCSLCNGDLSKNYAKVVDELCTVNAKASSTALILPASTVDKIDRKWNDLQKKLIERALSKAVDIPVFSTVALSADVLRDGKSVAHIVEAVEEWDSVGIYLVVEHPHDDYLSNDTLWLLNYMSLVAGLKLVGKCVYVGYASHQQLNLVLAKCDALFSGSFLNMRHFQSDTFKRADDDSPSRHARWYYAPHLLSEFRTVTLDVAYTLDEDNPEENLLSILRPPAKGGQYADILFKGAMPSGTAYDDKASFLHYLDSLHWQCGLFSKDAYQASFDAYAQYLQTASKVIEALREKGIYDRNRSYLACLDASESAIRAFDKSMGLQMKMEWGRI